MEIWTNGQQPKQESPKLDNDWWIKVLEENKRLQKQNNKIEFSIGSFIIWWIVIFCILGAIFGGNM